jgi:hypothetical protein
LLHEAFEQRHGLGLIAGVVVHLAAAGLALGKVHVVAEAFENADDRLSSLREQSVVIAGDEE